MAEIATMACIGNHLIPFRLIPFHSIASQIGRGFGEMNETKGRTSNLTFQAPKGYINCH
jgi:hypothetical protein